MKQILLTITALLAMVMIGHSQANQYLSNLLPTAVNTHLLPGATGIRDLGSGAYRWRNGYFNGSVTAYGVGGSYGVYGSGTTYGVRGVGGTYGVYGSGTSYGVRGVSSSTYGVYGSSTNGIGGRFHSTNQNGLWASTSSTAVNEYAGVFDRDVYVFGTVTESSDKNIKKNIQDFGDAMSIINKLKPKNFEFRNDGKYASLNLPKGIHYGLIAQDLEEVLPNLVRECVHEIPSDIQGVDKPENELKGIEPLAPDSKETIVKEELKETEQKEKTESINIKGINYTELIPVMIKAMQQLDAENKKLKEEFAQLENLTEKYTNIKTDALSLSGGYLSQNAPNPGNNSTVIGFRIPEGSRSASLLIAQTASGKIIKTIPLAIGASQVTLETGSLASGAYVYSLLIDGKKIDTKQMLIER